MNPKYQRGYRDVLFGTFYSVFKVSTTFILATFSTRKVTLRYATERITTADTWANHHLKSMLYAHPDNDTFISQHATLLLPILKWFLT
ncbi:hypothetical protein SAMN04488057_10569 [Cyclobacterium lianum]|uniref:Uncharacterized protein n=1 Tax=Cyclobacterium lianum TaxID=388280 RepID=A0A1M7N6I4_9BACT|nr:hypothetical protein SAMN04488057_10569 [Cyclobacterium lianum]